MRFVAIKCMSKSYRPTVPVRYAARVLGFVGIDEVCEANGADGLEECKGWLKAHGAILSVDNNGELLIDTKVNLEPGCIAALCFVTYVLIYCDSFEQHTVIVLLLTGFFYFFVLAGT